MFNVHRQSTRFHGNDPRLYYNIHNIVKVQSEVLLYELEYFASEPFSNPDIIISVTNFVTSKVGFRRSVITDDGVSHEVKYTEHLGPFGAQFAINFSHPIEISVNRLISKSRHVLYVNLVEPILRFLMISKGYVLLHSACIALDGHGLLLSAPPDTGKTTTVLNCVKRGFSFLSDDMTIIRLPNTAICFPKPMTISAHTFETAVSMSNNGFRRGLRLRSLVHSKEGRQFMRKLSKYNVPVFTINAVGQAIIKPPKFRIEDVLQSVNIQNRTNVETLYLLQRGGEETLNIPVEIAIKKAIENSDDAFLFPPYNEMLPYIDIGGKSAHSLLEEEIKMLSEFLSAIKCVTLKSDSRSWYSMVNEVPLRLLA